MSKRICNGRVTILRNATNSLITLEKDLTSINDCLTFFVNFRRVKFKQQLIPGTLKISVKTYSERITSKGSIEEYSMLEYIYEIPRPAGLV